MEGLFGIITADGMYVEVEDGRKFILDIRLTDDEGFPEVLIDAKSVGGSGWMHRQSTKPFIGMKVKFITNNGKNGYNFEIINP